MAKLKVHKGKALLLAIAALMCASMLVQGVLPIIAQDATPVPWWPHYECVKYDDQGECVKWELVWP